MEHFITEVRINEVRHLKNITIKLNPEKRQHLILTGKNGSGKTSVLQAMKSYLHVINNGELTDLKANYYNWLSRDKKEYETAKTDDDYFSYTDDFENVEITEAEEEYILGTTEIDYTDSVYSAPMMSSIAYQCVLLRVSEDQDIEAAKKLLEENADPAKWICVEAESVVVENVGDVILFIMADKDVADAAKEAFLALKK